MNKTALVIITTGLVIAISIIIFSGSKNENSFQSQQNVEVIEGVQYVTINAKGGYSPRVSVAQADIPTKLVMKTNGTYDCSLALVIKSLGYQKILPQTGEEVIDLGTPEVGALRGLCSMGMYNFTINFQ